MFLHVTTIDFRGLFLNYQTTASSTGVKAGYRSLTEAARRPAMRPEADLSRSPVMLVSSRLRRFTTPAVEA
jgi:hypothetical protein